MHDKESCTPSTQVDVGGCTQPAQMGTMSASQSVAPALAALAVASIAGSAVLEMGAIGTELKPTLVQQRSVELQNQDQHASTNFINENQPHTDHKVGSGSSEVDAVTPPPLSPPQQKQLICPRCDSKNTKFCYYNNYSVSQPRHFCKTCRRYWTQGGTLRNIPVGGGCRKNKRSAAAALASKIHYINNNNNNISNRTGMDMDPLDHTWYVKRAIWADALDPTSLQVELSCGRVADGCTATSTRVAGLFNDYMHAPQISRAHLISACSCCNSPPSFLGSLHQCAVNSFDHTILQLNAASFLSGTSPGNTVGNPVVNPLQLYHDRKQNVVISTTMAPLSLENELCSVSNQVSSMNDTRFNNSGTGNNNLVVEDAAADSSSIRTIMQFEDNFDSSSLWSHSLDMLLHDMYPFSL